MLRSLYDSDVLHTPCESYLTVDYALNDQHLCSESSLDPRTPSFLDDPFKAEGKRVKPLDYRQFSIFHWRHRVVLLRLA